MDDKHTSIVVVILSFFGGACCNVAEYSIKLRYFPELKKKRTARAIQNVSCRESSCIQASNSAHLPHPCWMPTRNYGRNWWGYEIMLFPLLVHRSSLSVLIMLTQSTLTHASSTQVVLLVGLNTSINCSSKSINNNDKNHNKNDNKNNKN